MGEAVVTILRRQFFLCKGRCTEKGGLAAGGCMRADPQRRSARRRKSGQRLNLRARQSVPCAQLPPDHWAPGRCPAARCPPPPCASMISPTLIVLERSRMDLPTAKTVFCCFSPQSTCIDMVHCGKRCVNHEAICAPDNIFIAQIQNHQLVVHRRATFDLFHSFGLLLEIQIHALLHVRQLQNILDKIRATVFNELHHQLIVADPKPAETPPGPCAGP